MTDPKMRMQRLLIGAAVFATATTFAAQAAHATTSAPTEAAPTTFEVKDGGAHCQTGPLGNHWRWDVRVIPGSQASSWAISSPWEVVNVDGPNANDRLILHTISTSSDPSGTASVTVNGTAYDVTPTMHYGRNCPTSEPTCETDPGLCPPPPVPTCEDDASLCPPVVPTCETDETLCPPVEQPKTPPTELVPPTEVARPAPLTPTSPPSLTTTSLAYTGISGPTTLLLIAVALVAIAVGISARRAAPKRKAALREANSR